MLHLLRQLPRDWRDSMGPPAGLGLDPWLPEHSSKLEMSTGRGAIAHLICLLGLDSDDTVLMPSYIAEGVVRPFRQHGVRVRFYRLNRELQPDEADIVQLVSNDRSVKMIVIVHPLGFEAHFDTVRRLARAREIFVLEDCAHALFSEYGTGGRFGTNGDFALFSLNKFLPVPDGAVLLSARPDVDVRSPIHAVAPTDRQAIDYYLEHLHLNAELLHSATNSESRSLLRRTSEAYDRYYARINTASYATTTSEESSEIRARYDCTDARDRRRENMQLLYSKFPDGPVRLLYPKLTRGVTCFAVPAVVPPAHRNAFILMGMKSGVLFSTLVDRWNFVPEDKLGRFFNEDYYMRSHILIPVNEFLDLRAMEHIVATLGACQRNLPLP